MRICPQCNQRFPDDILFCPEDGTSLVKRNNSESSSAPAGGEPDTNQQFAGPSQPRSDHRNTDDDFASARTRVDNDRRSSGSGGRTGERSRDSDSMSAFKQTRPDAPPSLTPNPASPDSSGPSTGAHESTQPREKPPNSDHNAMDPSNLIGQRLFGEYTIQKKLGEGGMGSVYLARQDTIDQKIAVKVLHEDSAENQEMVDRFHREARVVSMLTHPNIIRVFIFGRTQSGLLYLAMEYVKGVPLRQVLDQPGLIDEMRAIKIIKQICSGLSEAHDLGIIHRDLKPDNVLLTEWRGEEDFAKILDFGIAKLKQPEGKQEQKKLTQAGVVYGTPEYLSPEQAQAFDLDHRTDLYSLGCILYEFMTGQLPFTAKTPVKIMTAHVFNEPTPPSEVAPNRVSPTMENIILKAMAKEPEDRFQDGMEMFEALVAREQEIVREKKLTGKAGYVPGMELTGMYGAIELPDDPDELDMGADTTAERKTPANPPSNNPPTQPTQPTQPTTQPTQTASSQTTSSTATGAEDDNSTTRLIIYLLIAGIIMLFLLLVAGGVLYVTQA